MDLKFITENTPVGSKVICTTKSGREIFGTLVHINEDSVIISQEGKSATFGLDIIAGWEIEEYPSNTQIEASNFSTLLPASTYTNDLEESLKEEPLYQSLESDYLLTQAKVNLPKENSVSVTPINSSLDSKSNDIVQNTTKQLVDIEISFDTRIQNAKIEVIPPDFSFPVNEISSKYREQAQRTWNRARDKYNHAKEIGELSVQYGRLGPILTSLQELTKLCPDSLGVFRQEAYICLLAQPKNRKAILEKYQKVANKSKEAIDWYNLAVIALESAQSQLACSSLKTYFQQVNFFSNLDAWCIFIGIIRLEKYYLELKEVIEYSRTLSTKEENLLLDTLIYLFIKNNRINIASL